MKRQIKVLLHNGIIGSEIRPLYFYKAMKKRIVDARIISFGACNFACPYCKRNGHFRNQDGSIVSSVFCNIKDLYKVVDDAIKNKQVIRLSGGDPVSFQDASISIARYVKKNNGKLSIAHNGSSPEFVKKIIEIGLESAAIDLKATKKQMNKRTGLRVLGGKKMYEKSIETQKILSDSGVLLDIRTPIFADTKLEDLLELANDIVECGSLKNKFWTLRLYKSVIGCSWKAPDIDKVLKMIKKIKNKYPNLKMGLRAKWEPSGFLYF